MSFKRLTDEEINTVKNYFEEQRNRKIVPLMPSRERLMEIISEAREDIKPMHEQVRERIISVLNQGQGNNDNSGGNQ